MEVKDEVPIGGNLTWADMAVFKDARRVAMRAGLAKGLLIVEDSALGDAPKTCFFDGLMGNAATVVLESVRSRAVGEVRLGKGLFMVAFAFGESCKWAFKRSNTSSASSVFSSGACGTGGGKTGIGIDDVCWLFQMLIRSIKDISIRVHVWHEMQAHVHRENGSK